jgi:DNA-binding XRE family transcriptional regulator
MRGKPRDYVEWKTLRRWEKLPGPERQVPGYLLRLVREEAGMTQSQLAGKLSVSQQAVGQAERWTSNPTIGFMSSWYAACGKELFVGDAAWIESHKKRSTK